ncbi:hypothetical protein BDDG_09642, partial [Blastomyces dermatitidis ATCC 18188]
SSCIDRSVSADNSELSVKSLIENLKNVIIKELSVLCVTESLTSLSALSVSFSVTLSQSSTPVSVSGSSFTTSVPATLTSATSDFTISAFIISSPCFKKILYRLNESSLSRIISLLNSIKIKIIMNFTVYEVMIFTDIKKLFTTIKFNIAGTSTLMNIFRIINLYQPILWHLLSDFMIQVKNIHVFRNENADIVLFYTHRCETYMSCLRYHYKNELFTCCVLLSVFSHVSLSLSEKPHACFASVSEIILIKDDNTVKTTLFCSQASSVTFSPFSAGKVVRTSGHK